MICLFALIAIGFIVSKWRFVPENTSQVLSKLENILFVPALVMGTFIDNFTVSSLSSMWKIFVLGFATVFFFIAVSLVVARICYKEKYLQKIACVFQLRVYGQRDYESGVSCYFYRIRHFHAPVLVYDLYVGCARVAHIGQQRRAKSVFKTALKIVCKPYAYRYVYRYDHRAYGLETS